MNTTTEKGMSWRKSNGRREGDMRGRGEGEKDGGEREDWKGEERGAVEQQSGSHFTNEYRQEGSKACILGGGRKRVEDGGKGGERGKGAAVRKLPRDRTAAEGERRHPEGRLRGKGRERDERREGMQQASSNIFFYTRVRR